MIEAQTITRPRISWLIYWKWSFILPREDYGKINNCVCVSAIIYRTKRSVSNHFMVSPSRAPVSKMWKATDTISKTTIYGLSNIFYLAFEVCLILFGTDTNFWKTNMKYFKRQNIDRGQHIGSFGRRGFFKIFHSIWCYLRWLPDLVPACEAPFTSVIHQFGRLRVIDFTDFRIFRLCLQQKSNPRDFD